MHKWHTYTLENQKEYNSSLFPVAFSVVQYHTPGDPLPPHCHDEIEFIYVTKGEMQFSIEHESFHVQPGDCLFINSGQLHTGFSKTERINYYAIAFNPKFLINNFDVCQNFFEHIKNNSNIIPHHFHSDLPSGHDIIEHIKKIITTLIHKELAYELIVNRELLAIFSILIQSSSKLSSLDTTRPTHRSKNNERLKQIITYIKLHYHEKITLTDISNTIHVTPQYLCRFFKNMTNMSLTHYINHYRIKCACNLLEESNLSITDIALMCGFDNISYFNRVFKQHIHCTPRTLRLSKK